MKALLLTENWEPRVGGIETYLHNIADQLQRSDFEITVVVPSAPNFQFSIFNFQLIPKKFFWPVVKPAWLPLFIFLWRKAKRKDFEVLLCGKALFEGLLGYYLKKYLGIPYVVFTYGMEIGIWNMEYGIKRKLERVLRSADRVIYINEVTKKKLLELGLKGEQLLKMQPGIDPYPAQGAGLPLRKGEKSKKRYILSVGRLIPRKGFDTLIEAFGLLDQTKFGEVELWIVGDGPHFASLREATRGRSHLQKRVRFLGKVSDEELQVLYAGAEIFALTPKEIAGDVEGFGIVYLEAAAHGLPAVGTRTGGVPEAVIHNETGLLAEPNNPKAIAIALMQLLANEELRERLGKQAQLRVQEEFAWVTQIEPLTQALKAITE